MSCEHCRDKLYPKNERETPYVQCSHCGRDLSEEASKIDSKRTSAQNRALHAYLRNVAEELDREGHTMQDVTKAIKRAEIRPTMNSMKEVVWKPLQEIITGKKSTTDLEKGEVDKVYEVMNKWLGDNFGVHIPFNGVPIGEEGNSDRI